MFWFFFLIIWVQNIFTIFSQQILCDKLLLVIIWVYHWHHSFTYLLVKILYKIYCKNIVNLGNFFFSFFLAKDITMSRWALKRFDKDTRFFLNIICINLANFLRFHTSKHVHWSSLTFVHVGIRQYKFAYIKFGDQSLKKPIEFLHAVSVS